MDAVFRLADRISVLVSGRVIATGTADEIRASAEVRRAYLGDELGRGGVSALLEISGPRGRLRRQPGAVRSRPHDPRRRGGHSARPQRHGQDHDRTRGPRAGADRARAASRFGGERIDRLAAGPHRAPGHRRRSGRAADLPQSHRRGEPDRLRGEPDRRARAVDAQARVRAVPAPGRAPPPHGQRALRRRAADAGDRTGAGDQSAPADPRRGHRGAGAAHPRGDLALPAGR